MLERFESVNKVGLFDAYAHSPGCDLSEVTLIYGENGVGKSTLAAILDSLRERNAVEIIRRRSLPGNIAPTATVTMNGKAYDFDGNDWKDQPPYDTLEVFFPGFVTRNVHAATAIGSDHRRNLCEFVLGRTAVEKVARLTVADTEGREALAKIRAIEKELQLLIEQPDTLERFLGLTHDANIENRIENARSELKQARSKDAILKRPVASAISLPSLDRSGIATLFGLSIDDIGADVARVIQEHINKHLDKNGEHWLAAGAKYAGSDDKCPFCDQKIGGSSLVAAIRSYFSTEYRIFTDSLSLMIQEVRDRLGATAYPQMRAAFSNQVNVASQWMEEVPIDPAAISTALTEAEAIWNSAAAKLEALVASKQAKPLEKMDPGFAEEALAQYERTFSIFAQMNNILSSSGEKADGRKAALSKADTREIEQRLCRLVNQKVRFEPLAQDLIEERNAFLEKRARLEEEKTNLKTEIEENATRVAGKYQAGINHYLNHFGCDISIESVKPNFPSGRASVQYKLKAHGHEIDLGTSVDGPCFETVLSEGDKFTLALSFFFARLRDHRDLTGRVVVLDDPVNSLGSTRRTLIVGVVRDLRARGAQIVILTHDERLAALIWRDKKLNKAISALQVERTNSGSRLQIWDIERATQSEYVAHYLTLQGYLDSGGDHKPAAVCIRPYLEQRLRHLFPGPPFLTRDALGDMIRRIRESAPGSRVHTLKEKVPELESINDASLPSHHATDDVPGMDPLAPADVRLFAQKALDVLG